MLYHHISLLFIQVDGELLGTGRPEAAEAASGVNRRPGCAAAAAQHGPGHAAEPWRAQLMVKYHG